MYSICSVEQFGTGIHTTVDPSKSTYLAEVGTYDDIKSVKHIFGNPV
jgi:hypothetical protein